MQIFYSLVAAFFVVFIAYMISHAKNDTKKKTIAEFRILVDIPDFGVDLRLHSAEILPAILRLLLHC